MGLQRPVFKACFLPQIKYQKGSSPGAPRRKNCGGIDSQIGAAAQANATRGAAAGVENG